jgi:hypothetical protein
MKIKIIATLILCLGFGAATINLSGCSAGGHIGPVGGSARVG